MDSGGKGALHVPRPTRLLVLLAIGLVGLPALEAAAALTQSVEVRALSATAWVLYFGCVLLVGVVPVLVSGWARRLANQVRREQPGAITAMAVLSLPHTPELVVVAVDEDGFSMRDKSHVLRFPWTAIQNLELRYTQAGSDVTVAATDSEGRLMFSYIPLGRLGAWPLNVSGIEKYVNRIRAQRVSNSDRGRV